VRKDSESLVTLLKKERGEKSFVKKVVDGFVGLNDVAGEKTSKRVKAKHKKVF
jgi:hypothetical protein